jgi:nucleoside 2-deoxyribosyltransferase
MFIYQAGPLFSRSEQNWNSELTKRLEEAGYRVTSPSDLLAPEQIRQVGPAAPKLIFSTCLAAVKRSDCIVACLDGAQVDDGTAWELGFAYALGLPIFGIRTDSRRAGETDFSRVNSMIQGCLHGFADNIEDLLVLLKTFSVNHAALKDNIQQK